MKVLYEHNNINLYQVLLKEKNIRIINIDKVFKNTNLKYYNNFEKFGLNLSFDFSLINNRRLYTHHYLMEICDLIKINSDTKLLFYRNTINMEKNFIDKLIKKTKTIFGLDIIECDMTFDNYVASLVKNSGNSVQIIDKILYTDKKPKTFKHIKKYLHQNGLTYLDNVFFNDSRNKMILM
jgi:hypothetical protein